MTTEQWLLFVGVWFASGLPLGPNALNCIAVAASQGVGRALWAVCGILIAASFYIAAVAFGLGAVLLANEALFTLLKLAGAAYLVWLGIGLLRRRAEAPVATAAVARGRAETVQRAILISLSNPKAMIAYGAVFSQFITPDRTLGSQLAVLAPTALVIVAIIYTGYSVLGVGVKRILGSARRMRWFDRCVGGFYVFAGSALAIGEVTASRPAR